MGIYDDGHGKLVRTHRVEVDVTGERTDVPELVGVPRGKLVLVNDDDLTYGAVRLDPASLTTLIDRIADITEPSTPATPPPPGNARPSGPARWSPPPRPRNGPGSARCTTTRYPTR